MTPAIYTGDFALRWTSMDLIPLHSLLDFVFLLRYRHAVVSTICLLALFYLTIRYRCSCTGQVLPSLIHKLH